MKCKHDFKLQGMEKGNPLYPYFTELAIFTCPKCGETKKVCVKYEPMSVNTAQDLVGKTSK